MKDMDKDTRILMGSMVLDVRRLPDKVARGEEDAKQAFCFLRLCATKDEKCLENSVEALQHTYNAEDHHTEKVK
nr:hypothetical protein [Tanacetum cinerariifolium]